MDRVAIGADYVVKGVLGSANVRSADGLGMAAQAIVENFLGREFRKSDDAGFAPARLNVRLAGTMAALAAGALGRFFSGSDALEVRVLVEISPDVGMASAADVAAYETGGVGAGGRLGWRRAGLRRRSWVLCGQQPNAACRKRD